MSILDAIIIARKTKTQASGLAVLSSAAPIMVSRGFLSISDAITQTKSLTQHRLLDSVADKVRMAAAAVVRGDQQVEFYVDPEEKSALVNMTETMVGGVRLVAQAVARGAAFVLTTAIRYMVLPILTTVGSVLMRCLPLIFNPYTLGTLGVGALGYGAYQFFKRFSDKSTGDIEVGMAPSAAAGAPKGAAPRQEAPPPMVAPSSVIPTPGAREVTLNGERLPLGIRNNNPGNLRYAGQPGANPNSGPFAVFPNQGLGLFNLARQIGLHYYNRKKTTVRDLITIWAPPNENQTNSYVTAVAARTGLGTDTVFDFQNPQTLVALMRAIIAHENGMMPYSDAQLYESARAAQSLFSDRNMMMPVAGVVSSEFGHRTSPVKGASTDHQGVDIAAPEGSPVVAATSGVVTSTGTLNGYGQTVDVRGGQVFTRYAHLSKVFVKANTQVRAGDPIGAVGSTGTSSGAHLHFEIRTITADGSMGRAVNPSAYLGGARKGQKVQAGVGGSIYATQPLGDVVRTASNKLVNVGT